MENLRTVGLQIWSRNGSPYILQFHDAMLRRDLLWRWSHAMNPGSYTRQVKRNFVNSWRNWK